MVKRIQCIIKCEYCKKIFSSIGSRNRHIKTYCDQTNMVQNHYHITNITINNNNSHNTFDNSTNNTLNDHSTNTLNNSSVNTLNLVDFKMSDHRAKSNLFDISQNSKSLNYSATFTDKFTDKQANRALKEQDLGIISTCTDVLETQGYEQFYRDVMKNPVNHNVKFKENFIKQVIGNTTTSKDIKLPYDNIPQKMEVHSSGEWKEINSDDAIRKIKLTIHNQIQNVPTFNCPKLRYFNL